MKTRVSPAVVGAFVVGAFTLGVMALLFFGGVSFFRQQQRFLVYFDESIQGLNLGSPVKLRGVAVGRVVALNVRYDQAKNQPLVAVTCEFDRNMIRDNRGQTIDVSKRHELESLVSRGLRAQLGTMGLATGLLFVELDFFDPQTNPAEPPPPEAKYAVVPAILSTISEFQASADEILTKLKRVDFEGLSNDVKFLLADARQKVDSLDLKGLTGQWQKTGAAVENLVNSPDVKRTFTSLNDTLADLRATLKDLHHALGTIDNETAADSKELQATLRRAEDTLRQFDASALTLRRFIDSQQGLGDDAHEALTHLSAAAQAVARLADYLERNPNALISGRAK